MANESAKSTTVTFIVNPRSFGTSLTESAPGYLGLICRGIIASRGGVIRGLRLGEMGLVDCSHNLTPYRINLVNSMVG